MVALPNERSLHDLPTPFGGGIAIVITWYTGLVVFYITGVVDKQFFLALMSGVLLAIVSLIDDIVDIKPVIRLFFHFVTAILAFWLLGGLRPLYCPDLKQIISL